MGQSKPPTSHILPLKPSIVYDTYWRFAAERQAIHFRRLERAAPPWTDDPILRRYKFTNAYRAADRVSQYLIRNVIYGPGRPAEAEEVFFRIMVFKLFNKVETWEGLEAALGALTLADFSYERYDEILERRLAAGKPIYSAAYIMPAGTGLRKKTRKHRNHLLLVQQMIRDRVPGKLTGCGSMRNVFEILKDYPGIGDFLAYQYATDVNYSEMTDFPESDFVVPGPGAINGIRKVFADRAGRSDIALIHLMCERQESEFARLGLEFLSLWGRPLQPIDCQNLFCEVDKYARVRHPEAIGASRRTQIKQRFKPKAVLPHPWYPPKWKLNEKIERASNRGAKY